MIWTRTPCARRIGACSDARVHPGAARRARRFPFAASRWFSNRARVLGPKELLARTHTSRPSPPALVRRVRRKLALQHHPGTCREHSPFDPRIPAPARLRLPANVTSLRSAPPRKGPSIAHALAPLPHSRQKSRQPRGGAAIQGGGERVRVPDPRGWGGRSGRDLRLPGGHARFCRHVLRVLLRRRLRVMVALRVPRRTRRTRRRQIVPVPPLLHTPRRRRVRLVRLGIYRRGRGRRVWRSERLFHPGTAPGRGRARRRRVVRRRWRVAKRPHPPPR